MSGWRSVETSRERSSLFSARSPLRHRPLFYAALNLPCTDSDLVCFKLVFFNFDFFAGFFTAIVPLLLAATPGGRADFAIPRTTPRAASHLYCEDLIFIERDNGLVWFNARAFFNFAFFVAFFAIASPLIAATPSRERPALFCARILHLRRQRQRLGMVQRASLLQLPLLLSFLRCHRFSPCGYARPCRRAGCYPPHDARSWIIPFTTLRRA